MGGGDQVQIWILAKIGIDKVMKRNVRQLGSRAENKMEAWRLWWKSMMNTQPFDVEPRT